MNINLEIKRALAANFPAPDRFFLGVSGGTDSQVLLHAFPHVCRKLGHEVEAVGVNHGLRPEADSELDLAENLARSIGVPFHRVRIRVAKGSNLQARAREERYSAIRKISGGCPVVTAHHADDRAETVLIRLLRSNAAGALAVLPPVSGDIFRPMISISRADILRHLKRWNLPFASDPSNSDDKYLRVFIRNQVMPLLQSRSPLIMQKLNRISDDLLRMQNPEGEGVEDEE